MSTDTHTGAANPALAEPNSIDTTQASQAGRRLTYVPPDLAAVSTLPEPTYETRRQALNALLGQLAAGAGLLTLLVLAWWGIVIAGNYPTFILPTPLDVAARMGEMLADGSLLFHFRTTFIEAMLGFLVALVVGLTLGYLIGHSHVLERLASPYIAISQGLPVVAIAPLLVIWFQDDLARNIVIVALIVFFPVLVNTIVGVRGIDRSMLEVARISGANRLQTILYVELPLGLRSLLGGMKLGLTLSITGAVVGELVSSDAGLGFLLIRGRGVFDTPQIFVGLVMLALLTMLLYTVVTLLEKLLITWD